MPKFELTFNQYINIITIELKNKLSEKCTVLIRRDTCIGGGGLKSLVKKYPQYDSIKIDWGEWHYILDTKEIESA